MKNQGYPKPILYIYFATILSLFNCENETISPNQSTNMNDSLSQGELITINTYNGKQLTYRLIDGKNILEDDIILTEDQIYFLKNGPDNQNESNKKSSKNQKTMSAPGASLNRWTNSKVNFKISFISARSSILTAINHLESNTNIDFVEQAEGNYIDFVFVDTDQFCGRSNLGMIGGRQEIELNCTTQRTIIHEILHALGFYHEHSRLDRDNYININWNNIKPESRYNFDTNMTQSYGDFDYNSIMLYSSYSGFAINTSIPVMTRKSDGSTFSGGSNLSTTDINSLLDMYYIPNSIQNVSSINVGANSNGDYIYIKKNLHNYELYKNGVKINSNLNYSTYNYGIDIANNGEILTSSSGYSDRYYDKTIDISEGNGSIFCLSVASRFSKTTLFKKNGDNWLNIINDNSFKRLTVDNQGRAWVLSDNKIKVFHNNGSLINTIDITPYVTSTWDRFHDIGNAGDEIYVSIQNTRNNGRYMLLKYSSILDQFIEQPKPSVIFSIDKLDGSGNGNLWYSK